MKEFLIVCLVAGVSFAAGRIFDGVTKAAAAGGGVVAICSSVNGDVNADGKVDLSDAVTILGNLFLGNSTQLVPLCTPQGSSGLPDTGQTKCFDGTGAEVACDGETCPGQNGFYGTGCPSEGCFADNRDGTVTDSCTGLMWQKDAADANGDGQSDGFDVLPWCDALSYCDNLSFAGQDDWRLPNVLELQSIVDYGRLSPIDPVFGGTGVYWSSTTRTGASEFAWHIFFGDAGVSIDLKAAGGYVRAVRNAP